MTIKADFTEEEWNALEQGVIGAGLFVSVSDPEFTDTISETNALITYVGGQGETSRSELVRELAKADVNPLAVNAPWWRIETNLLTALRSASATLAAKAPQEVDAYRDFVLGAADHVARERGGVKVRELTAIDTIRKALEVR